MTAEKIKITKEEAEELDNFLSQEQKNKMIKLNSLMMDKEFIKRLMKNPKEALKAEGFEVPNNLDLDKKRILIYNFRLSLYFASACSFFK